MNDKEHTSHVNEPNQRGLHSDRPNLTRTWPHELYRELRRIILNLEGYQQPGELASYILKALVDTSLRTGGVIIGGRLYQRSDRSFRLVEKYGESGSVQVGYEVPLHYAPIQQALHDGWTLVRATDPEFDPAIEAPIGAETFAAIVIGPHKEYLLSFSLLEPVADEELIYALVALRQIADLALRHRELREFIEQAREIQTSLLPKEAPLFPGYDIAFRSRPAEIVGGDLYDFIPVSATILGCCIGDATGHGLPAALQARDVIIGLRMGAEENLKILKTMEKLSRVVRNSSMGSRFVSLVYAEIEKNGNIVYVNAGHPPPFILRRDRDAIGYLTVGGPIMGLPFAVEYERSFARIEPGDVLVMYTDGLTEARNERGEEFDLQRLVRIVRSCADQASEQIVEQVFKEMDAFCDYALPRDDQTLVVIRREPVVSDHGA